VVEVDLIMAIGRKGTRVCRNPHKEKWNCSEAANTRPYILALSGLAVWLGNHFNGRSSCYAEHDIARRD